MIRGIIYALVVVCLLLQLILLIILFSSLSCEIRFDYLSPFDKNIIVSDEVVTNLNDCKNMTLKDATKCVHEKFVSIFVYNMTYPEYDYKDFETVDLYIRQNGGDCHESAKWYYYAGKELGFESKYVEFVTGYDNTTKPITQYLHAFAVISDNTGYCVMDQNIMKCEDFLQDGSI